MKNWKKFSRVIFLLTLLTGLLAGVSAPALGTQSASAAPMRAPLRSCPPSTIAQWTFTGNVATPSTGSGIFANGSGLNPAVPPYTYFGGPADPAISFSNWAAAYDPNDYLEFAVDTTGKTDIGFSFDYRSTATGPNTVSLYYFIDGTPTMYFFSSTPLATDAIFHTLSFDLSSIPALNNNPSTKFRLHAYGATAPAGSLRVDNVTISDICILPTLTPTNTATSTNTPIPTLTPAPGIVDLSVIKTVNNQTPTVDDSVVFSITVSNTGPGTATASYVVVKDLLPNGFTYLSHTSGETYDKVTGLWSIAGVIPVGTPKILKITAKVNPTGPYANTVSIVSFGQTDPNPSNDSVDCSPPSSLCAVTPSGGNTNLSLELTDPVEKVAPGVAGNVVLTIKVTNIGLNKATNIIVKDDLPTGLTYVSDTGGGSYNKTTGFWSVGAISAGGDKTLNIIAKVDPTGTLTYEAEIWSADQSPADGRIYGDGAGPDYDSVTVQSADLSITKTMDNVTPALNTDVVFTIRVTNAGPNIATGVQVRDMLNPSEYQYLSDDSGGNYDGTYSTSTTLPITAGIWDVGNLGINQTKTLRITATVKKIPVVTNWAEVYASTQIDIDSVPGNKSRDTDDDSSAPSADLRLEQAVSTDHPGLNTNFTYTITVSNDGTVGATGVVVKAKLPSGVTWKSDDGGTSYVPSTGYWTAGTVVNGGSKTLTITAQLSSTFSGIRTSWAEVWTASPKIDPDSTPGNGSTTEDDDASATVYFRPVLINEVAWSGTAASRDDQWIELYNPNTVAVNISGWVLKNRTGSFKITLNGSIAAGGFFLLERDSNSTVSDIAASQIYNGALATSNETLILCSSDTVSEPCTVTSSIPTNVIDTANYVGSSNTSNPWPAGKTSTTYPASMERRGNTAESDSVWVTNTGVTKNGRNANGGAIYGTPGKVNSTGVQPTATPIIRVPTAIPIVRPIINEFLARPGYDWNQDGKVDVYDEFIEIKNIGITDVNLKGWQLDDEENSGSTPFKLPTLVLKPGQHAVFYGLQTNILLSDGGDTVRLLNPDSKIYDAYTYPIARVEDRSVCRLPDGNGSWYEDCIPTPNLINSREGEVPSMPGGAFESPICQLPDTLPADFLFAECRGYGADIWHSYYWDQFGWQGDQYVPENMSKWESFVE